MNRIYKLVWSKVRNTWVVASEIAKSHGKNPSASRERKVLKSAIITAIMGGGTCYRRLSVCGTYGRSAGCL